MNVNPEDFGGRYVDSTEEVDPSQFGGKYVESPIDHGAEATIEFPTERTDQTYTGYSDSLALEASMQTGEPVSVETRGEGLPFGQRYDFARSNEFSEMKAKFNDDYPEGDLISVKDDEGNDVLLFRTDKKQKQFKAVNPLGLEAGDFSGALEEAPNVAAGTVAALVSGGATLPAQFMLFAGTEIGAELGGAVIEKLRGYQDNSMWEEAANAGGRGLAAGLGTVAISGLARGGHSIAGHRSGVTSGAREASGIIEEYGVTGLQKNRPGILSVITGKQPKTPPAGLPADKASTGVFSQKAGGLIRASSPVYDNLEAHIEQQIMGNLDNVVGTSSAQKAGERLASTLESGIQKSAAKITSKSTALGTLIDDAGVRIAKGFSNKANQMSKLTKRLYGQVQEAVGDRRIFSLGDDYGGGSAGQVAREIKKGVRADVPLKDSTWGGNVYTAKGDKIVSEETVLKIKGDLNEVANAVIKSSEMPQSFSTVKGLRSRLFDLKQASKLAGLDNEERLANNLYMAISKTMENPANADDGVVALIREASIQNFKKDAMYNDEIFTGFIESTSKRNAGALIERFSAPAPGNGMRLQLIKDTVGAKKWASLQDSFKTKLMLNPQNLKKTLDSYKEYPDTLNKLMPPAEQNAYRLLGEEFERLYSSAAARALAKRNSSGVFAVDLIENQSRSDMADIVVKVGGVGSEGQKDLQRTFMDKLISEIYVQNPKSPTGMGIDAVKYRNFLKRYDTAETRGTLLELFKGNEGALKVVKDMQKLNYHLAAPSGSDMGASLAGTSDVSGVLSAARGNVSGASKGAFDIKMKTLLGELTLSRFGQKVILGSTKSTKPFSTPFINALTDAAIITRNEISKILTSIDEENQEEN